MKILIIIIISQAFQCTFSLFHFQFISQSFCGFVCRQYQAVENSWNDIDERPCKLIIALTDRQANDTSESVKNGLMNEVGAIRYIPLLVVVSFKISHLSTQALNQQITLKISPDDTDLRVFESKIAHWIVIPNIDDSK